jgi:hypothetical protein
MVYKNGEAADNSFKKATFKACVITVRRVLIEVLVRKILSGRNIRINRRISVIREARGVLVIRRLITSL